MLLTIGAIGQSRLLTEIQSTSAWQPVLNEALNEAQGQKFKAPVFLRHRACVLLFFVAHLHFLIVLGLPVLFIKILRINSWTGDGVPASFVQVNAFFRKRLR